MVSLLTTDCFLYFANHFSDLPRPWNEDRIVTCDFLELSHIQSRWNTVTDCNHMTFFLFLYTDKQSSRYEQ